MPLRELLDTSFMAKAPCRGLGFIMFPPDDLKSQQRRDAYERARSICAQCAVRSECLEWAMLDPEPIVGGVVAGLLPDEVIDARRAFKAARKANRAPRCGTSNAYNLHLARGEDCLVCREAHSRRTEKYAEAS